MPDAPRLRRGRDALALASPDLDARPLLLVSDFDGTLARIVTDPWGATILPPARRALRRLAAAPGVSVAVLSGRNALDVASLTRVGGAIYLGDHGLQRGWLARGRRAATLEIVPDPAFAAYVADAEGIATEVTRGIPEPWLIVEAKGPSVAFHYRGAPDIPAAGERVAAIVEAADPEGRFSRFRGRRIFEIRPPAAATKGEAFRTLLDEVRPAAAIVLGDDRSDAQAFGVLTECRQAGRLRGLSVAVHAHAEMPPGVAEAADIVLASPHEAAAFLGGIARRLRA
jgi:trehalose 6-phosphate phosphatase